MMFRAEIYRILSECYKEPSIEFAGDAARGDLCQALTRQFARLGIIGSLEGLKLSGGADEVLRVLQEAYYPLFTGPFPPFVLPVESVHKAWAREEATPLIAPEVKGMLMGDRAIDMLRRYKAAGIEIPTPFKDMPDHLALLLEYMALMCEHGTQEDQRRFLRDHLDWLPELRRLVYDCTKTRGEASRFYRTVTDATAAFVSLERSESGKAEEYRAPFDQTVEPS